jgi:hypothetical protein
MSKRHLRRHRSLGSKTVAEDAIRGMSEAQHVAGDFLDEIGVRGFLGQERDVPCQLGTHGFEALEFELQERDALDELASGLEAMATIPGMMREIGC